MFIHLEDTFGSFHTKRYEFQNKSKDKKYIAIIALFSDQIQASTKLSFS